ncbi:hypothetical protein Ciccas_004913 [Cichlidogyrus casuarinus]|uniref:receptor protein serine/threonine kinase n=1 Tax=Cichlidogyrus casuarinus TaxID=1844966 RepID=A0ABD2QA63_9PLAT
MPKTHYYYNPLVDFKGTFLPNNLWISGRKVSFVRMIERQAFKEFWLVDHGNEQMTISLYNQDSFSGISAWHRINKLSKNVLLRSAYIDSILGIDYALTLNKFYPNGTLGDLLRTTSWNDDAIGEKIRVLYSIISTIAAGLSYLHSGSKGKPGLAHRDLHPNCIYLEQEWNCVIGSLDMCVARTTDPVGACVRDLFKEYQLYVKAPGDQFSPLETRFSSILHTSLHDPPLWWPVLAFTVTDPAYAAPEIGNEHLDPFDLEVHQRMDMYALGLIVRDQLRWVLKRDLLKEERVDGLEGLFSLMWECLDDDASLRPTSLRFFKTLKQQTDL